jgi:predicted amidohydrolase YtcJ
MPELILLNGNFRALDRDRPKVNAVAIKDGRILAVGDNDKITAMADPSTQTVDLGGRVGLPGMMDSHFHFYDINTDSQ